MPECAAESAVQTLIEEAVAMAIANSLPLERLQGIALYDMERDAILIALKSFNEARQTIVAIPNFIGRFGTEAATRIVLQLVYQYFRQIDTVYHHESIFKNLWCDFTAEVQDAYWVIRSVANVRNFDSNSNLMDLGDGVTIQGRSPTDLALLGFDAAVWDRIAEDWRGLGASSFVLVAEHSFSKQPNNLILLDSYQVSLKATRAIWSLRLADAGSISVGPMWVIRPARFNVGLGGLNSVGASIPAVGSRYSWTEVVPVV